MKLIKLLLLSSIIISQNVDCGTAKTKTKKVKKKKVRPPPTPPPEVPVCTICDCLNATTSIDGVNSYNSYESMSNNNNPDYSSYSIIDDSPSSNTDTDTNPSSQPSTIIQCQMKLLTPQTLEHMIFPDKIESLDFRFQGLSTRISKDMFVRLWGKSVGELHIGRNRIKRITEGMFKIWCPKRVGFSKYLDKNLI